MPDERQRNEEADQMRPSAAGDSGADQMRLADREAAAQMWRTKMKSWGVGLVGVLWMLALVTMGVPFGSGTFWLLAFLPTTLYVVLSIWAKYRERG